MKKLLFLSIFLLSMPASVFCQVRPVFSGDVDKYRVELEAYIGPNLHPEQGTIVNAFTAKWDSSAFSSSNMLAIADLSSKFTARQFRAVPQFTQFLKTLIGFIDSGKDNSIIGIWLGDLKKMAGISALSNENIYRYLLNSELLVRDRVLISTPSVRWKIKSGDLKFARDTAFVAIISNATLTCYSQRDSTEIYNASGRYIPESQQFHGTKGTVTWEKAGFPRQDVYAQMSHYVINVTRNNFTCDSATLEHRSYFTKPVYGLLSDQAASIPSKERASFPRFETYTKKFRIKNVYKGIDYEGGLAFDGATVKGKGEKSFPARMLLYKNDTLFIKITSAEFVFSGIGLNSQETEATLYLGKDSIYHTNLGFSYNSNNRQVNLFRTNNPVSGSPFFDTYHMVDMYFESLTWDMNGSKAIISRPRGAAMGQARFESSSFFNANYFLKLMGLDDYNPLTRLIKFSEWFYSETFPVSEFAKWLDKPEEAVVALCIDMANRGFVFYDRVNQEVTIKKKTKDFIDAYAGKKDYDVLSILSETRAPVDNAVLDLNTYGITINGVKNVFLSDSQKVAIFPYNQQLVLGRNRDFRFNGVVQAGLFTFFGHDFRFSYDTFRIKLQKIDSIMVAVETDKRDAYGNPIAAEISSLIQLGTGELYIDDPSNKSGLKSLAQYPIINSTVPSYVFYDKIPGLENVYKKKDFYFKVDPFVFDNIDHYKQSELNLPGEFFGGSILKPMRQYLTIQENNSLGFKMNVPEEGIEVYDGSGKFYDQLNMSSQGLIGSGTLKHLTSETKSEEYKFFPDSMLTQAVSFKITRDSAGLYPDASGQDIKIKWFPQKDEFIAFNAPGNNLSMFGNGTILDGNLTLSKGRLKGEGIVNTAESRINSRLFAFNSNEIRSDTADYFLKSTSTSGYAFIAEDANTDVNFASRTARFHLNTDSSVVKLPEIQYICTMTDFQYDMNTKILSMVQKGKTSGGIIPPSKLLSVSFAGLDKPTFFSTNSQRDTVAFSSLSAKYDVEKEVIEADNISYIKVADALIQPENGRITIGRRAQIERLKNAYIAVNNRYLLHSADIGIESAKRYSGSAVYDYVDESKNVSPINFEEIGVDTMTTTAKGFIAADQKFMLSPAFTFTGDVNLSARVNQLLFTGSAGIIHDCSRIISYPVKFKSLIDPRNVMIPVSDKPRDSNDNLVFSGSYLNIDSIHIYPAFLSAQKSWTDAGLVTANGFLWYNKAKGRYEITSAEKIADPLRSGNLVALDRNTCLLSGEGKLNFGANFDLVKMISAGNITQTPDSGKVEINAILALDFFFSADALKMMSDGIRMMPTLKPVNVASAFVSKSMNDLLGETVANALKMETDLFGPSKNLPKEYSYELLLNDVKLRWNEMSSSFRSTGRIGIGIVGGQPLNVYVDGYIEIQRRRSGDMIDIYLKADRSTWYYFSYFKGIMMAQSGDSNFNNLLSNLKEKDRKDPGSTTRAPYTYMIAVENRLNRFLRRMEENNEVDPSVQQDIVR
ncbi:MAG: hypothetical protein WCE64_09670 [Bacteroidales bacterium]